MTSMQVAPAVSITRGTREVQGNHDDLVAGVDHRVKLIDDAATPQVVKVVGSSGVLAIAAAERRGETSRAHANKGQASGRCNWLLMELRGRRQLGNTRWTRTHADRVQRGDRQVARLKVKDVLAPICALRARAAP